jgi:hypothetical protein
VTTIIDAGIVLVSVVSLMAAGILAGLMLAVVL